MIRLEDDPLPITPGMSCEDAFRRIALPCLDEIDRQLAVFFGSDAEEGPHKTRVALRRLTTAMDAFAPILRRSLHVLLRREAKVIFRALGEQRDADVYLAGLAKARRTPVLLAEAETLREKLRADLRAEKAVAFAPRFRTLIDGGEIFRRGPKSLARRAEPVDQFAREVMDEAWQTCLSHGKDVADMGGTDQHEFRKDLKSLRYLSEFFADLWPAGAYGAFRDRMQELQDALGHLNDLRTARAKGRKITDEAEAKGRDALDAARTVWSGLRRSPLWWAAATEEAGAQP
jgi:CHAD domain-containing protein